jgi:hypothetical protein
LLIFHFALQQRLWPGGRLGGRGCDYQSQLLLDSVDRPRKLGLDRDLFRRKRYGKRDGKLFCVGQHYRGHTDRDPDDCWPDVYRDAIKLIKKPNMVATTAGLTVPRWAVTPALGSGTTYSWRARAVNPCGPGPFSTTSSFQTAPWLSEFLLLLVARRRKSGRSDLNRP